MKRWLRLRFHRHQWEYHGLDRSIWYIRMQEERCVHPGCRAQRCNDTLLRTTFRLPDRWEAKA